MGRRPVSSAPGLEHLWGCLRLFESGGFLYISAPGKDATFLVTSEFSRSLQKIFKLRTHFTRVARGDGYESIKPKREPLTVNQIKYR